MKSLTAAIPKQAEKLIPLIPDTEDENRLKDFNFISRLPKESALNFI